MCFYRNIGANYRGDKLVDRGRPLAASLAGAGRSAVFRDERLQYIQLFSNLILGPTLIQEPPQLGDLVIAGLVTEQCELRSRQSDCSMNEEMMWTDYPRRAKRTSLFAIRERELLAAQDYAPARSRRGLG
jgi:hypothetical protein